MNHDRIVLTVPAHSEFARTVRMTASELALRLGMSYDEVDDVRLATEEAFVLACDLAGEAAEITFTFMLEADALTTEVGPLVTRGEDSATHEGYAEFILRSICDSVDIEREGERVMLRLRRCAGTGEDPGA